MTSWPPAKNTSPWNGSEAAASREMPFRWKMVDEACGACEVEEREAGAGRMLPAIASIGTPAQSTSMPVAPEA